MLPSPPSADGVADVVSEIKALSQGKKFSLDGFDKYPDISETPTGILSSDFEAAMFLKTSVHVMLTTWFDMQPSANPVANMSTPDVVVIMESGVPSVGEKLQSYASGPKPSIAIVLCSTYASASSPSAYGSLRVFYVPQPFVFSII
jgi:hypothetical protein